MVFPDYTYYFLSRKRKKDDYLSDEFNKKSVISVIKKLEETYFKY